MTEPRRLWTIVIARQPQKEMRRLPGDLRQRIDTAIQSLSIPMPARRRSNSAIDRVLVFPGQL